MLTPIPTPLCAWLTLLAQAVPNRSALTFLELLLGAMITDRGFVTEALLAITPRRKWPTYFKWLEGGKWSWIAVAQRLCKILVTHFAPPVWYLVIDDTLVPRASKKAPDVGFHFDHSRKPNRSRYIWGQGWVTLAAVVHAKTVATSWAVPLISRLVRKTGNHGKLTGARVLLRVVRGFFGQGRLLLDTWFMRASVSVPVLSLHKTSMPPRSWIAERRFTITSSRDMRTAPRASVTETTIGRSSGVSPTASASAKRKDSI